MTESMFAYFRLGAMASLRKVCFLNDVGPLAWPHEGDAKIGLKDVIRVHLFPDHLHTRGAEHRAQ